MVIVSLAYRIHIISWYVHVHVGNTLCSTESEDFSNLRAYSTIVHMLQLSLDWLPLLVAVGTVYMIPGYSSMCLFWWCWQCQEESLNLMIDRL